MGIIVNGNELDAPDGLVVKNFHDPAVYHFKNQVRGDSPVTEVVVHETVTTSWASTVSVLKERNLGVHFIVDADGTVYQHADLTLDDMWHASQHNKMSVGIETVNPYEPGFAPAGGPWTTVLDNVPWSASTHPVHKYLVPTPVQAEAVCQLLNWLTSTNLTSTNSTLSIPQLWPGLYQKDDKTFMALTRVQRCATPPEPGILAHMYWAHGDGAWLVLYAWLRLEAGLDQQPAYEEAQKRAQGAMAADLSDLFADNPYLTV